jgi:predicted site-specific integrase-resolvase
MKSPRPAAEPMLTAAQAATRLGVDPRQVYHYIAAGLIAPVVRLPTRNGDPDGPLRIEESVVEAFIAAHRQPATA